MPSYRVEALERFIHRTTYYVEADSPEEAERLAKAGGISYEDSVVEEGDEEWLNTEEIQRLPE
jgi:hypothetical protein